MKNSRQVECYDNNKVFATYLLPPLLPVNLLYREYPMGHEVSQESLDNVTSWLSARLDTGE